LRRTHRVGETLLVVVGDPLPCERHFRRGDGVTVGRSQVHVIVVPAHDRDAAVRKYRPVIVRLQRIGDIDRGLLPVAGLRLVLVVERDQVPPVVAAVAAPAALVRFRRRTGERA